MRIPLSWLRQYAPVGENVPAGEVARRLTGAGLEVETVEPVGHDISGVVVARVTEVEELTGFRKPVRYCGVDTGSGERHVICGAVNFAAGDKVALAAPGAVLPGGFEIVPESHADQSAAMANSGSEDESDSESGNSGGNSDTSASQWVPAPMWQ